MIKSLKYFYWIDQDLKVLQKVRNTVNTALNYYILFC